MSSRTAPLFVAVIAAFFKDRADLVAENVALRHQLSCLRHRRKRPKLRPVDRALWAILSRAWGRWTELLVMVKPATVVGWHRQGFKLFWTWKSRKRRPGRPRIHKDIRKLIVEMASTNVGWGAPRIHGELLKLGIQLSETTVKRYMPKKEASPKSRQRWLTFLRRDSLDHVIAISEGQLRRVIGSYISYFHEDRTHLGLNKDTPMQRAVDPPESGKIVAFPRVGGLHRRYSRKEQIAA